DGTWDDGTNPGDETKTNVYKLYNAVKPQDATGVNQVPIYIKGIGTENAPETSEDCTPDFHNFVKGAVGIEVSEKIQSAYRQLVEQFSPEDQIFVFGFSRGAFQARSFAHLVTHYGILPAEDIDRFSRIWRHYLHHRTEKQDGELKKIRAITHWPQRIRCLGVWDTVGNLGLPVLKGLHFNRQFRFHNTQLNDKIDIALQALAIDENRGPFSPTLWTRKKNQKPVADQIVEQVWFPGSHVNVGGGFSDSGLSDIALIWMAERVAETSGLSFELGSDLKPDPLGRQYDSQQGLYRLGRSFPFVRLIRQNLKVLPYWRRLLLGPWRTNWVPENRVTINESIHESARNRLGKKVRICQSGSPDDLGHEEEYRPHNLVVAVGSKD
ncbi:MAG: DUF2235 domain-containing protein, partial [Methyloligellaceae bacterium]